MTSLFQGPLIPGLFIYKDRSGLSQGLLFQFNPETLKRSRTVSLQDSSTKEGKGTTTGQDAVGRKYSMTASRWKIDLELRLDASRTFPKQLGLLLSQRAAGPGVAIGAALGVMMGIRQLESLVEPTKIPSVGSKNGFEGKEETPEVDFYWGLRVWKGFVTSLTINETLFSVALLPMMVEASISMEIIEPMSSVLAGTVGGMLFPS